MFSYSQYECTVQGLSRINNSPEHVWTGTEIIRQRSESGYTPPPTLLGFRTTWKCREVSKHITQAGWNIKGYWLAWERAPRMPPVLRQAGKLNFPLRTDRLRYLTLVNITWKCVLSKGQVRWLYRPTVSFKFKKQHKSFTSLWCIYTDTLLHVRTGLHNLTSSTLKARIMDTDRRKWLSSLWIRYGMISIQLQVKVSQRNST